MTPMDALRNICANAELGPDMGEAWHGTVDIYKVPLDDIEAARAVLANAPDAIAYRALPTAEYEAIANEARRYASHYPQSSDGRNTFILLAEWIEARAAKGADQPTYAMADDPQLGDTIQFSPDYRFAADWRGEFTVIGIRFDNFGRLNLTISEGKDSRGEWMSPTDDFRPEDMIVLRRAARVTSGLHMHNEEK
jgi:hypothetical protein